jgi:hypothetical protein
MKLAEFFANADGNAKHSTTRQQRHDPISAAFWQDETSRKHAISAGTAPIGFKFYEFCAEQSAGARYEF